MSLGDLFDKLDRSRQNPEQIKDSAERALVTLFQNLNAQMKALDIRLETNEDIPLEELEENRVALAAMFDTAAIANARFEKRGDEIDTKALKGAGLAALPTIGAITALAQSSDDQAMLGMAGALALPAAIIGSYVYAAKLLRDLDNRIQTKRETARIEKNFDTLT